MKLNEPKYYSAAFLLLVIIVVGYFVIFGNYDVVEERPNIMHPLQNEAEYTESFDQSINQAEKDKKIYQEHLKTPEGKKASDTYWNKMTAIAKSMLRDIEFYGRIEDQNGNPVAGALIEFYAAGGYLTEGTGYNRVKTDTDGIFHIIDAKGDGLSIEKITKPGYEIKISQRNFDNYDRFDDSVLWKEYISRENPYVFKAWKVGDKGYPITSEARGNYGFKPGKIYSLDLTKSHASRVGKIGEFPLDLQVLFNKDESGHWELTLTVPDGGLLESDEIYMNFAPASGYVATVRFQGNEKHIDIHKNYYIHSRGKLYGRLKLTVKPHTHVGSGLIIEHVMNLDGGRNLEVN